MSGRSVLDCIRSSCSPTSSNAGPASTPTGASRNCASVSARNEACGNDSYSELTESARRGPKTKLCLAPLYAEGKCYSDSATSMDVKAVECAGANVFKVSKVVKEAAAPQCAEGEQALTYPELKLNYCLGLPA